MLRIFSQYGRDGASSRVRVYQWLERCGVEHRLHAYARTGSVGHRTLLHHPLAAGRGELHARFATVGPSDTVLVHRAATPFGQGTVEGRLLGSAGLGVYDFDDALQWEPPRRGLPYRFFPRPEATLRAVQAADRVIAGNPTLAEWAAAHAADVRLVPSCVEPSLYVRKHDYGLADPPVIGWVGSPSTFRYLGSVAAALLEVNRRTGAVLEVIGAPAATAGPLETIIRRITWTGSAVHNRAAGWDLGVMPLTDGLYERGKCGYKLLEYGAAGLPVVGSPVGVNREILGRMAAPAPTDVDDWVEALTGLLDGPASARAEAGARARRVVEEQYSYAVWEGEWRAALGLAAAGRPARQPVMVR